MSTKTRYNNAYTVQEGLNVLYTEGLPISTQSIIVQVGKVL